MERMKGFLSGAQVYNTVNLDYFRNFHTYIDNRKKDDIVAFGDRQVIFVTDRLNQNGGITMARYHKEASSAARDVLGTFAFAASTITGATYGIAKVMMQYL